MRVHAHRSVWEVCTHVHTRTSVPTRVSKCAPELPPERGSEAVSAEPLSPRLEHIPVSGGHSIPATRPLGPNPLTHLPERVLLLRENLEVLLGQLHRGQCLQPEAGPGMQEAHQVLEGVQAQAVVPVVGQVGHEDADLEEGSGPRCERVILTLGASPAATLPFLALPWHGVSTCDTLSAFVPYPQRFRHVNAHWRVCYWQDLMRTPF